MKALHVTKHSDPAHIELSIIEQAVPVIDKDEVLIKVASSGVNPSDALAITGFFKDALVPRIPGRDFAGEVIDGPPNLIGKKVWGTGGVAGIYGDGTQAEYIKLPISAMAYIPNNLDVVTAGAQTLPYVTAYYALVQRANIQENNTVLVVGALGQVGQAAMSIVKWQLGSAMALVRGEAEYKKAQDLGWNVINSEDENLHEKIITANHGQPVDVILNSVGNIYWQAFMQALAVSGRIITIAARDNAREVNLNLFELYRANQTLIGVNTLTMDFVENAKILSELKVGFEENKLIPLALNNDAIYSIEDASKVYQAIAQGKISKRVAIKF